MLPDLTTSHVDCDEVRRLVAQETASIEMAFALRDAAALYAMRPHPDTPETRAVAYAFAASARTLLRLAGLPADLKEANRG